MSEIKYPEYVCFMCNTKTDSSEANILRFGEWHTMGDISVHNFCLYFTSGIAQCAKNSAIDDEGYDDEDTIEGDNICGFLLQDIEKKVKKNKRNKCKYCKMQGACTWCADKKCQAVFHFDCGQQNDIQYQFYGQFNAFCAKHYDKIEEKENNEEIFYDCCICEDALGEYHKLNSIQSCCKMNWYHRDCVRKAAYYQGYDMKCLSCGTKKGLQDEDARDYKENTTSMPRKEYIRFLQHRGIFVPKRMPIWELEPNAYAELLPNKSQFVCIATECLCEKGRDFSQQTGTWEIFTCITCGGRPIHFGCFNSNSQRDDYICTDCYIQSQTPDYYKALSQNLAMTELLPQMQRPAPVIADIINYVRKEMTDYETELNPRNRDQNSTESEGHSVDVKRFKGKRKALILRQSNEGVNPAKPLTDAEYRGIEYRMYEDRLEHFFKTAPFGNVPQYMPALDRLKIIWAKEEAEKKNKDATQS